MRALVAIALFLPSLAYADDDRTLSALLLAHHEAPTRAQLESKVSDVRRRLIAFSTNVRVLPPLRDRAIDALAAWPDAEVEVAFRTILARDDDDRARHRVLFAYGRAFPREAPRIVGAFLESGDRELRRTAVESLARVPTPAARAVLDGVQDPALRARIERARRASDRR